MDTGLKVYRNPFPIKFGTQISADYGKVYPVLTKLMYPGDVFRITADLLIRYQPMLTPPMNDCVATVRFSFSPLRLLEENTELVITGSKDGKLNTETLPVFDSCFKHLDISGAHKNIEVGSLLDLQSGVPSLTNNLTSALIAKLEASPASPAAYFNKAYYRFWWDYYRDENLFGYDDFETFWQDMREKMHIADDSIMYSNLQKNRFTAALPWQLKATAAPRIQISGTGSFVGNPFAGNSIASPYVENDIMKFWDGTDYQTKGNPMKMELSSQAGQDKLFAVELNPWNDDGSVREAALTSVENKWVNALNSTFKNRDLSFSSAGFTASDVRDVMAQTRIFERLARCGSRYTEYLRANFNVAPSDGTLQRSLYLGGFKTRIVTTEVIQMAGAGDNPVGTLRGHGITHGTQTLKPFMAKEIGVLVATLDVKPEVIYAQGVERELTARKRFDFFNPSFQHLSEQEVRNGEIFFDDDVDDNGELKNNGTWGFQPYAEELRKGVKHVYGEMRGSLSYWNQALIMSSRPALNQAFLNANNHKTSFMRPFTVTGAKPMVVDFGGVINAYRPLVRDGTPGLNDHN